MEHQSTNKPDIVDFDGANFGKGRFLSKDISIKHIRNHKLESPDHESSTRIFRPFVNVTHVLFETMM